MDEFLSNGGKSRAIPVFVFYTSDHRDIAHFAERAAVAHAELAAAQSDAGEELHLPEGITLSTVAPSERQAYLQAIIGRIQPRLAEWRVASIREMRVLLSTVLQIPNAPAD
jgi:hypothetical protein